MNQVLYWNKATHSADPFCRLADLCAKSFHEADHLSSNFNCFFCVVALLQNIGRRREVKAKPVAASSTLALYNFLLGILGGTVLQIRVEMRNRLMDRAARFDARSSAG